jgi:hypothetical protein
MFVSGAIYLHPTQADVIILNGIAFQKDRLWLTSLIILADT